MGNTVSRDHAKLPFGYTHARKDHSVNNSSVSRKRLASRLLRTSDTTSITPFPIQDGASSVASIPDLVSLPSMPMSLQLHSNSNYHYIVENISAHSFPESGTLATGTDLVPESDQRATQVVRTNTRSTIHSHHHVPHSRHPAEHLHSTSSGSSSVAWTTGMTNPDMVHASSTITANTTNTSTLPASLLVSPPSSSSSSTSRYDQEPFNSIQKQKILQTKRTQEEQDKDMDIISALSIAERPYQSSSYDFFSSSNSSNPLPSSTATTITTITSQQLLTKQDSKTNQSGSTAIIGSDFRGHASSKKTPCYELKGDDLQKLQDDDEQNFMDSWDENTLRLEECESDSILDEEMEQLSPIPFSELQSLTNIGLCNHKLVRLSSNIRLLTSATCVQLCCNELSRIPAEIGFLRNLTLLDLSKNNLTSLPETITYLTKLVDLKLSCNQLESIPAGIGGLTKLAALSLDNNKLESIPPQIGLIKGLVSLDLSDNPITVLPAEVGKLQFLRRLKLDQCPLIEEFSHSPLHSPPTLLELAARVIVRHDVPVPPTIVPHLKEYIESAGTCSFCDGPYFDSWVKRGKMIEKNEVIIPLEYTLCQPHWNTEQERIKLLFCKRPITSPPPKTPTVSSQQSKAEPKTISSSSSSSSSSSGPATLSSSGSSSTNAPNRSANGKYISENGARERPLSIIGGRFSFLKNPKGSSGGSNGSGSNSSRGGNGGRPISTYRTNSMPAVMSSTSTLVSSPSPLSSVSVYSSSGSTSVSTTTSPSVFGSNNPDIATTTPSTANNSNNNNNVNNGNSTRPTVRRSVTSAIFARATSKLRRPLSMGPGLESAVVGLGLSAAEAGPAPAE